MSVNSLRFGPVFGIALVSLVTAACSGDAFRTGSASLDNGGGGSGSTDAVNHPPPGGKSSITPTGGSAQVPEQTDGGAPPEVLPAVGGAQTAGSGGAHSAGAGGVVVIDPPDQGQAGESNVTQPPIDPNCAAPISETWSEPLATAGPWYVAFGDPSVDTQAHRLVLSYDDVAERTQPYDASYYLEGDVTIDGGTAFTPYPYTFEVILPTLRRDATGKGIELGATQYGPTNWTATGWGAASGSVIATTKLRVGAYLQVTSKKFAVKVSYGAQTFRSTWVTDFHWAKTNLGIMRYVGENNSGVYHGGSDKIYVDPISGCQGLSDADVEAAFKN